jgi:hypothetical protein
LVGAAIVAAIPQLLSKTGGAECVLRTFGEIGRIAASVVAGDLHRKLLDPGSMTGPWRRWSGYTPPIDRGGVAILFSIPPRRLICTRRVIRKLGYMEKFELRKENAGDWLQRIACGKTCVTPSFEQDDCGTFLTAHAPIYESHGL